MGHFWRSLTGQLFLLVILPLTTLLICVSFSGVWFHQQTMRTMIEERDKRAVQAIASTITQQLLFRLVILQNVAQQAVRLDAPAHVLEDTAGLTHHFEGGLALFSPEGQYIASSNPAEVWDNRPLFPSQAQPLTFENNTSARYAFVPNTEPPLMLLMVQGENGVWAVGAINPTTIIDQAIQELFTAADQTMTLVRGAQNELIYYQGATPAADHTGHMPDLTDESGVQEMVHNSDEHVVVYATIRPVGWELVLQEPWASHHDPFWLQSTEWTPLILAPALVVALLALWLVVRQVVQPLQQLATQTSQIGAGEFTAIEQPVGGIEEIQKLQTHLVQMAQEVAAAQNQLRHYLGAVTSGQEEERKRLARDLHDETIQALIALNQRLQLAQMTPAVTAGQLTEMQQMVERTMANLRRLIHDLRPIYLEDLGLGSALEMLGRETSQSLAFPVTVKMTGRVRRLPAELELALYRIAQEGLSNVVRHAQANQAQLTVDFGSEELTMTIVDNGRGFVVPATPQDFLPQGHLGLLGMSERAELVGARLAIYSAPGRGTRLTVVVNLAPAEVNGGGR